MKFKTPEVDAKHWARGPLDGPTPTNLAELGSDVLEGYRLLGLIADWLDECPRVDVDGSECVTLPAEYLQRILDGDA